MSSPIRAFTTLALAAVPLALGTISSGAQPPPPAATPTTAPARPAAPAARPRVIGTHHIDRYAAIEQVRERLRTNPKSLSDWIILGELAHEVGVDAAPGQAAGYFKLSREAYEKALALAPNNPGLKAAVQFAQDYEQGNDRFATIRNRATQSYLAARRRDLEATNYVPAIRVMPQVPALAVAPQVPPTVAGETPVPNAVVAPAVAPAAATDPTPAISPAPTGSASTDAANFGVRQIYSSTPTYLPFYTPTGRPLTYQQYQSAYYPAGIDTDAGELPVTVQRYAQQQRLDANLRPVDPAFTTPKTGTVAPAAPTIP